MVVSGDDQQAAAVRKTLMAGGVVGDFTLYGKGFTEFVVTRAGDQFLRD
jgi:hypothetical protein